LRILFLLDSKNLFNILSILKDISIFELDIDNFEIILKHTINTYLLDNYYYHHYDKDKFIYFSINNARIYLIITKNNNLSLKKYDYLLDPLDSNETEELYLNDDLEYIYESYLEDIKDLIPTITKEKKIKQLNNLQNYLLSSLVVNEIKYNID